VRRALARLATWTGLLIGLAGLAAWLAGFRLLPVGVWVGGALAGLGLSALLAGDVIAGPAPRSMAARGQAVRGEVIVRAGLCDLSVDACGPDRVASVRHGPYGKLKFAIEDGVARLQLGNALLPNAAPWEAHLARNMLWDIDARSGLGDLRLDLSGLRCERVVARSRMGCIELTAPARGYAQIFLRTWLGEIQVHIPEHIGARLQIVRGDLASLRNENPHLLALDARRYTTPDYESATTQVEIRIDTSAGDIILAQ
jgi:hypothetical protein